MKTIGVVGAGPAGIYASSKLAEKGFCVWLWEKEPFIGGRTRMGKVGNRRVVGGAGVVRKKDKKLRKLAGSLLQPFKSQYHIEFPSPGRHELKNWISKLNKDLPKTDRSKNFKENMIRLYGTKGLHDFQQWVGYTDYLNADVVDTIMDYSFEDCLPGQEMYMVDWDKLAENMLSPKVHLVLDAPVERVIKKEQGFIVESKGKKTHVDILLWTAPRPTWNVLDPLFQKNKEWKALKNGVGCQSFLRLYALPLKKDQSKAEIRYPKHTLVSYKNPLGKVIPYGNNLYMISYSDNKNADTTYQHRNDKEWLRQKSGIHWAKTKAFYFPCGTHFFYPLKDFPTRRDYLKHLQNPLPGLFLAGEGISRNQGWTEGAIESADAILHLIK